MDEFCSFLGYNYCHSNLSELTLKKRLEEKLDLGTIQ